MNLPFGSRPGRPLRAQPEVPRRINLVVVMVAIVILLVAVSLPSILNASSTISTVKNGSDLQGCRGLYGGIVTDARTGLDQSNASLARANAKSSSLQDEFLKNLATTDKTVFVRILQSIGTAQAELNAAQTQNSMAAAAENQANDIYQKEIRMSVSNPDKFLSDCRSLPTSVP